MGRIYFTYNKHPARVTFLFTSHLKFRVPSLSPQSLVFDFEMLSHPPLIEDAHTQLRVFYSFKDNNVMTL